MKLLTIALLAALVYIINCESTAKDHPYMTTTTQPKAEATVTPSKWVDKKTKFIEKAKKIEVEVESEIKKLTEEGKTHAAQTLLLEGKTLKKLVTELIETTDEAKVKQLEWEVIIVEVKIKEAMSKNKGHDHKSSTHHHKKWTTHTPTPTPEY